MFENILSLIRSFLCESHSKIKYYCDLKCCYRSNVAVPTPKIINIFNCVNNNSLEKIKIPFDKSLS